MCDQGETQTQLLAELAALRQRVAELEERAAGGETQASPFNAMPFASQQNLAALIENTDGSIWSVDTHYRLIVANELYQRNVSAALGRRLLPGESVLQPAFPPAVLAEWQGYYDRALRGEHFSIVMPTRFARQTSYIEYHFSPIPTLAGSLGGVTVFGRDITAARQAEEQLRERESRHRVIAGLMSDYVYSGVVYQDGTTQTDWISGAFERITGYTPEEIRQLPGGFASLLIAEDLTEFWEKQPRLFTGEAITVEYRIRNRAGEIRWLRDAIQPDQPVSNPPGMKLLGAVQDITARKLAEVAVRESEEQLRSFVQHAPIGLGVLDLDFRFLAINDTLAEFNDLPAAAHLGQPLAVVKPTVAQKLEPLLQQILATGQPQLNIDQLKSATADGRAARHFVISVFPISDAHGALTALGLAVVDVTEYRQIKENLVQSEARFRGAFDQSPVGAALVSLDQRFISCNAAFCRFLGYAEAELIGRTIADITYPADRSIGIQALQQLVMSQIDSATVQKRYVRKDGTLVWGEVTISLVRDAAGQPLYFLPIIQDITMRRQAEDQLRQSEEKFRAFIEQSSEGVVITNEQGRVIEWNGAMERIIGLLRDGAVGRMFWDIQAQLAPVSHSTPMSKERLTAVVMDALRSGQAPFWGRAIETDIQTPAGECKSILQLSFPIKTADGYRIGALVRDITERKQAEAALRQSEEKYRILVDTASEGIWAMDREHHTTYVNQAMAEMLGYTPSDMLGRPVEEFFFAEDMIVHDQRMARRHAGQDEVYERRFRRRDGSSLWTLVSARATKDAAGEFSGSFAMFTDITARKQAEAALRENEARLKGFLDATPDAMVIANTDGRIILANTQTERLFGYTQTELLEMMVERLLPDRVRDIHRDNRTAFLADPREVTTGINRELRALRKDGSEFPVEISLSHHQLGDEVVVLSAIRDVTVRRQAEELVAAQRDLARLMTTAESNTAAWAQCLSIALRVSGLDSGGLYLFDDDQTTLRLVYQSGLSADFIAVSTRYSLQTANVQGLLQGRPTYFTATDISRMPPAQAEGLRAVVAIPILHRGRVIGALNTASHTTPQISPAACQALETIAAEIGNIIVYRRTETALRESEARARAMLNAIPDLMFRLDRAGVFLDYKADVRELVVQTEPTLLGLRNRDIAPASFADLIDTQIAATLNTGTLHTFEYQLEIPGQGVRDYEARMVPSGADEVVSIVRDITERKQTEAQIQQLNAELEERVVQRTAQLAAANDRLLDLDRLKTKFVSDVSHELRTPVTSLSLYIDLLEHGKPEKREQYVGKLKEQMDRLRTLINDILDLSRLERDRDEGGRSPVDINSIVEHVTTTQLIAAETAGLTLTCEVADNLPAVVARPDQLTRAITNLVSNAIKYTPLGTVRVQTWAHAQRVCIEVADTGLGIPADELPHLFERFYRGRAVAQSTIPGTGLGLSIVKEIIESHGGTVDVASELGRGSVFHIWLPFA